MTNLIRPAVKDIYSMLSVFNGLIVHFSAAYNLSGKSLEQSSNFYPEDLKYAINGGAQGGVASSIVSPTDLISMCSQSSMAVGCIGLILGLRTPASLVEASREDCGSVVDDNGNRIVANPRLKITVNDLKNTIEDRTRYNEWVVKDFDVLGVLAIPPFKIKVSIEIDDPTSVNGKTVTNEMSNANCSSILTDFGSHQIYTFNEMRICKLTCNGENHSVEHSEVYKS